MKTRKTKTRRSSLDKKLARLATHKRTHLLFHDRPDDGGLIEQMVRRWWMVKELCDERDKPYMKVDRFASFTDGRPEKVWSLADACNEHYEKEKLEFAGWAAGAFVNWNADFFEHVARTMRSIQSEKARRYDPIKPPYDQELRLLVLSASKSKPINQFKLACEFAKIGDVNKMSDHERDQVELIRRNIGNICRRLKIPSLKAGRPKLVN